MPAQSGRRRDKREASPPVVTNEAVTERKADPPATNKPAPVATLIVGGDRFGSSLYILPGYVDEAVESCMKRFKNSGLAVEAGGGMTRKEAIDRAKRQKDVHVLWLEIRVEDDGSDSASIGYMVLTPQTAKVLTSGRVYLGSSRIGTGGVGVSVPSIGGRMPLEYQLREGGRSVADRVMKVFQVEVPD
ncbi:MAG TPA: hypothetical protein VE842_09385 [Pyrinomonadaceae bacterium]|nr:hypothetical protein [Pyrinomonadaceae bacterium]